MLIWETPYDSVFLICAGQSFRLHFHYWCTRLRTGWLAGWLTLWWLVAGDDWMACLLPACLPWFSCNQSNNSQTYIKWHYIILLAAWLQSGWAERINRDWNAHQPSLHTAISRRWLFAGIVIKPQRPAEITIYTHIGWCCGHGWWW